MKRMRSLLSLAAIVIATQYLNLPFVMSALTDSCYKIYEEELNKTKDLDFSSQIGDFNCPDDQYKRYHCLKDESNRQIQLCIPWIFIDPGLCPYYVSYNSRINVRECDVNLTGCPREVYKSHYFYKYSVCLEELKVDDSPDSITQEPPKTTAKPLTGDSSDVVIIIVVIIIVIAIIIAVIIVILYKRGVFRFGQNYKEKDHELEPVDGTAQKLLTDMETGLPGNLHDGDIGVKTLLARYMTEQGDDPVGRLVKNGQSEMETFIRAAESKVYIPRFKAQMFATRCLTSSKYVLVTGEQGSGRKVLGKEMLVKYMYEGFAPVIMHDTMYVQYLMESDKKYAVVFDTSELNPGPEEDQFYSETLKKLNDKDNVVMTVIIKMGDYQRLKSSGKIDPAMAVDLSAKAYQMTNKDKKDLFKKYCKAKGIQIGDNDDLESDPPKISHETMNAICSLDIGKGFPKACEIFFSDKIAFSRGLKHFEGMQLLSR